MNRARSLAVSTLAFMATLAGCGPMTSEGLACNTGYRSAPHWDEQLFASGYFPESYSEPTEAVCGSDRLAPIIDEVEEEWYPGQWAGGCEPSIWQYSQATDAPDFAFRFSYIPSFQPSIFIRVESRDGDHFVMMKQLSGAGGYDPGYVWRSKRVNLDDDELAEIIDLLEDSGLFEEEEVEPVQNTENQTCFGGFDGTQWIFERADADGYAYANEWSPNNGPAYRIGNYFLGLTGWLEED